MLKAEPNRVTFTNVDELRPVFCDGYGTIDPPLFPLAPSCP